jgi:hypothetical protein
MLLESVESLHCCHVCNKLLYKISQVIALFTYRTLFNSHQNNGRKRAERAFSLDKALYIYIPHSYKKKRKKEKKNIPRSLPDFYIYFRGQKLGRSMSP